MCLNYTRDPFLKFRVFNLSEFPFQPWSSCKFNAKICIILLFSLFFSLKKKRKKSHILRIIFLMERKIQMFSYFHLLYGTLKIAKQFSLSVRTTLNPFKINNLLSYKNNFVWLDHLVSKGALAITLLEYGIIREYRVAVQVSVRWGDS